MMSDNENRKNHVEEGQQERRCDPSLYLNDACMFHIFSFVGGWTGLLAADSNTACTIASSGESPPPKEFLPVTEVGRFYYSLALVSRPWKEIVDESLAELISGGARRAPAPAVVAIDMIDIVDGQERNCFEWVCRHKLRIGRIGWSGSLLVPEQDVLDALIWCLRECNTLQIGEANWAFEDNDDLDARPGSAWMTLQDTLVTECPNIKSIGIDIYENECQNGLLRDEERASEYAFGLIGPSLFSHPSLRFTYTASGDYDWVAFFKSNY